MDQQTLVAVKAHELGEIFAEAVHPSTGELDLARLAQPAGRPPRPARYGDMKSALVDIRARNDELETLVDEFERTPDVKSAALRGLFGARAEAEALDDYHRVRVETPRFAPLKGGL